MRIIFELTGPGEVWIDNVKLYDVLFPLNKMYTRAQADILELVKITHSAQGAYGAGQISDCLQLIEGYWPRFVMAYTPPTAPKMAALPAVTPGAASPLPGESKSTATPPNELEQPSPGAGDRFKRWVPLFR